MAVPRDVAIVGVYATKQGRNLGRTSLSLTMEVGFCIEALKRALRWGRPDIFNSDQGSQFTAEQFTGELEAKDIAISMDGRGRCMDNIFIERLWRCSNTRRCT